MRTFSRNLTDLCQKIRLESCTWKNPLDFDETQLHFLFGYAQTNLLN